MNKTFINKRPRGSYAPIELTLIAALTKLREKNLNKFETELFCQNSKLLLCRFTSLIVLWVRFKPGILMLIIFWLYTLTEVKLS